MLLPFLPSVETDANGLQRLPTFQFPLAGKTLFAGVDEVPPGACAGRRARSDAGPQWWEVQYEPDLEHTEKYFVERLREHRRRLGRAASPLGRSSRCAT